MISFELGKRKFLVAVLTGGMAVLTQGCNTHKDSAQQDQEIRQKSAEAASNVKEGAKVAAADARVAAAEAERKLDDVAAGVKEGLGKGKPSAGRVNVNSASESDLTGIGFSTPTAHRIVEGRPYRAPHDLVKDGILTEGQYERVANRITVR